MKKKVISFLLFITIMIQFFSVADNSIINAQENVDYETIIHNYYEYIQNKDIQGIMNVYSEQLVSYIKPFAEDGRNIINHQGIYNIIDCKVQEITKIKESGKEVYESVEYRNCETFFVCVDMEVYASDKYYKNGVNYFLISLGNNGENIIYNVEIPSFKEIEAVKNETLAKDFYKERNKYLYNDVTMLLSSDSPVYVDRVENPSTIRIYVNGGVKELDFRTYLERTVAAECNNGLYGSQAGYDAAAMACKMFAIHKCLRSAHGGNYDILVPTDQAYDENKDLSNEATEAINNIYNWFALDAYGAVFPTFFRTQESDSGYCVRFGGILPQREAGTKFDNWKDIFRYYYTRDEDVEYYNGEMNYGSLIFTTYHTHDWSYGSICWYCGAEG